MPTTSLGCPTDATKVLAQNVYHFSSDHWIALKFLEEFLLAVFLGYHATPRRRHAFGRANDSTRVPAQKVYNF